MCSKRGDIISYLHSRLAADRTLGAMGSALEADILEKVPSDILEMRITCFNYLSIVKLSGQLGALIRVFRRKHGCLGAKASGYFWNEQVLV